MIKVTSKENCCGCSACEQICPKNSITMQEDFEGFLYPNIDLKSCINCGMCEEVCPIDKTTQNEPKEIEVYACKNINESVRLKSTSGGVFTLLAQYVLENHGLIFGAMYNEKFEVIHSEISNYEDIYRLRGSKYVQSKIEDSYLKVKKYLDDDRLVLFTGTPCQVAGLKIFLKKQYYKLILVDIICMGVPSPKVFKKYLRKQIETMESKPVKISFRDKSIGWKQYCLKIEFENKSVYCKPLNEDLYLKGFSNLLYLRPSCHNCKFKNFYNKGDITLGDYWGIQTKFKNFDDDKGTSIVLINTIKGKEYFKKIKKSLILLPSEISHAKETHYTMINSVKPNKDRIKFFESLESTDIEKLLKKYTSISLFLKCKIFVYKILLKIKSVNK